MIRLATLLVFLTGGGSAPPTPAPSAKSCEGIDMSKVDPKDIVSPRKIKHVAPVYPQAARDTGKAGSVVVEVTVTGDGKTTNPRVKHGLDPDLDRAALEAVSQWEYSPAYVLGNPCAAAIDVSVNFILSPPESQQVSSTVYPPDESLRVEDYVRAGMPAPDRPWSPDDHATAASVLEKLAGQEGAPSSLPRHRSDLSGIVFAKLTAPDNLALLRQEAVPVAARMTLAMDLMAAANRIMLVYLAPASRKMVFDRELAECIGFQLLVTAEAAAVAEEYGTKTPADDPQREMGIAGLTQLRGGLSVMFVSSLGSLAESDAFRPEARRALARYVQLVAPRLRGHLSDLQRAEVRQRLVTLAAAEQDSDVRASLASIGVVMQEGEMK